MARFNLVLEDETSNLLKDHVPRGIRSEFCRRIISMALDGVKNHGPGFIGLVISGDIVFTPSSNCQNLTPSEKTGKDEK